MFFEQGDELLVVGPLSVMRLFLDATKRQDVPKDHHAVLFPINVLESLYKRRLGRHQKKRYKCQAETSS